jgi:hypothetical protein
MSLDLRSSLDSLAKLSKKLNKITDDANETVRLVEQFLEECSLGLGASARWVDTGPPDSGPTTSSTYLRYAPWPEQDSRKFRILVQEVAADHKVTFTKPWSECDRDTKLLMLHALPALLDDIVKQAQAKVEFGGSHAKAIVDAVQGVITPKPKK